MSGRISFNSSNFVGGCSASTGPPGSSMGVFIRFASPTKISQSSMASKSGSIAAGA